MRFSAHTAWRIESRGVDRTGSIRKPLDLWSLADAKSNTLWVCSNDVPSRGVAGPSSVTGSHLKGFDLATGDGKISAQFPGNTNLCNDMTVASDGTVYVTNSLTPQILQLELAANALHDGLRSAGGRAFAT
jgi:hypothetical protein